ncbi:MULTISPECIES: endolytic transglycosylase MltG [Acidobacteriaceae]|uniref:endolytic transglycosylase MltG n=1 Tax=Acidobacteriaceae TaxID=204434 RepID=UPI00131E564C|nr:MULTISPECIES: endolytic transglycosylase MltG [Acidobacteriaceae]MDW5265582.1 endolytic transglycosylase MltG [Edaphobacter sp.]
MKFLGTLLLLILIAVGLTGYVIYTPFGPQTETFVDIAPGTGTPAIAAELQANGIIRNRYAFDFLHLRKHGTLKAGEYRFDHAAPMTEVYARIVRGDIYTIALKIPEGYNIFDIAQAVANAGLGSRDAFLAAERQHTELIAWLPPTGTQPQSLEGYLFPDTYSFSRHTTPVQILTAMVHRFRRASAQLGLSGDVQQTVTMASLVEKEVNQDTERPLVAGVFLNRLAKGMPLATDPTVIYAALLDGRWSGVIHASDLQADSPYNTYKHTGLPPGPICNPGMASLRAAMSPAKTDYLYFVSDAAGHSRFSTDLKEHAAQVQAYREAQKAQTP